MREQPPICRSCAGSRLQVVLSLGRSPLANALPAVHEFDQPAPTYPLDLAFCPDCTLVQLLETVPPEVLFQDYLYFSSFSDTMLAHAAALVRRLVRERRLGGDDLVIEAASNDGYLLRHYREAGIPVLGIEPARTVAEAARRDHGIPTLTEFFGEPLARQLQRQGRRADVFHAHNVLAHVPDLNGFAAGIARLLADDGVAVVEVPYVKELVLRCEFDTIYHEHLCYFTFTALHHLFRRHGLAVRDVGQVSIHGGSLRLFLVREGTAASSAHVPELLCEEEDLGMGRAEFYLDLAARVEALRASLRRLLHALKAQGKRLAAYGASAKGSTLLNYCGIGVALLDFVVDRSPYKQGRCMPGVRVPIHAPGKLLETMPDYVLLLTWNFAEEILRQQTEYLRRGGRFIRPIPEVQVIPPVVQVRAA
jgi:SAM-dependent methyltransferase